MSRLRDKGLRAALSALIAWLLALGLGLPLLKGFGLEGQMLRFRGCFPCCARANTCFRCLFCWLPRRPACIICWAAAGYKAL